MGNGETEELEFIIYHSERPTYSAILGFDLQKILKINIDVTEDPPVFIYKGKKIKTFAASDEIKDAKLKGTNTVDHSDDSSMKNHPPTDIPELTNDSFESNDSFEVVSDTGATLRGFDNFFLASEDNQSKTWNLQNYIGC